MQEETAEFIYDAFTDILENQVFRYGDTLITDNGELAPVNDEETENIICRLSDDFVFKRKAVKCDPEMDKMLEDLLNKITDNQ